MARRPRSAMEPRGSIAFATTDPRASFVAVPKPRPLVDVYLMPNGRLYATSTPLVGALAWLDPVGQSDEQVRQSVQQLKDEGCAVVRVLPRAAEDAALPAEAGSPSPLSDVSEVRPVVAELVAELPEGLRAAVAEYCEELLASEGL